MILDTGRLSQYHSQMKDVYSNGATYSLVDMLEQTVRVWARSVLQLECLSTQNYTGSYDCACEVWFEHMAHLSIGDFSIELLVLGIHFCCCIMELTLHFV